MAVSSGFGSAFTGFGSGYLNALRQGQSERSNLINAKIKREEINRKGLEDKANNEFRNLQKAYMIENQANMSKYRTDQAETSKDKLRNQTIYNATRLMTAHMPRLNSITDPLQAEAERAAVRNSVGSILSTSGHFKPEEIDSIAQSWLPSIGSEVQGSRRTVSRIGDIDPTKTKDINYADVLKQFGNIGPGRTTLPMQGPDGLPMAQDINVTPRDPYQVAMSGQENMINRGVNTAPTSFNPMDITGIKSYLKGTDVRNNNDFQGAARPEQRFDATSTPREMYQEQVPVTARTGLSDVDQAKVALSNATTANTAQRTELAKAAFPLEMKKIGAYIDTAYAGINNIAVQNRFKEKELNFRVLQLNTQSDLTRAGHAIQRVANDIASKRLSVSEGQLQLARTLRPQEVMSGLDRTITIAKQFLTEKVTALGGKKETPDMKSLREQINGMVTARSKLNTFSTQNSTNPQAWQDIAEAVLRSADLNNTLPNGTKLVDPKTGQRLEGPQRSQAIGNAIEQRGTALPFNPQNPLYRGGYENLPGTFGPNMNPDYYYGGDDMDYTGAFGQSQLPATGGAGGGLGRFFNFNDDGSY